MPDPEWWHVLWPQPDQVLAAVGLDSSMAALDLCCGDGLFTTAMARMACRTFAVDIDPAMIAKAEARSRAAGARCNYLIADAYDIATLVPERVDFVLMANTFHGVPDKLRLAHAIASVLAPAGRLAIVNWHKRPREETKVLDTPRGPPTAMRLTPAETAASVAPAGFRAERVIDLPPYHYGAIFVKPQAG
jgi:ubiquinone/menaquinone biosynthesis C-methylase UbiE